jgi:hypothetical protein
MKSIVYFDGPNRDYAHVVNSNNPCVNIMLSPNGNASMTITDHAGEFAPASWYVLGAAVNEGVYHRSELPKH